MPTSLRFIGEEMLLLQYAEQWKIVSWPEMKEVDQGDGRTFSGPNNELAVLRQNTLRVLEREIELPEELGPVQFVSWDGPDGLFLIAGEWGHAKNLSSLPNLLPIPSEGVSAQEFGAFSDEGMNLHRVSIESGTFTPLLRLSGIERFAGPATRFKNRIIFDHHRLSPYGTEQKLDIATISEGQAVSLFDQPGFFLSPTPSPAGEVLAFVHSDMDGPFPWWWRLAIHANENLTYLLPEELHLTASIQWSMDGKSLFVSALDGIRTGIIQVEMRSRDWSWLIEPEGTYGPYVVTPDGRTVIAVSQSGTSDPTLVAVEDNERRPLETRPSSSVAGIPNRLVRYERGDFVLEGLLATPQGDGPFPTVIDIHGGPLFELRDERRPELEEWVERGFAAFAPEYRASGILGKEEMLRSVWGSPHEGSSDCGDVLAGVDHLIASGVADPNRLFLFGFSYGARIVNWIVTLDHRFKAAVSHDGLVDIDLGYKTHGGNDFFQRKFGGSPWQVGQTYERNSISNHAKRVRTPMLLIYGDTAFATQGISFFTALTEAEVETELVVYRGEGHVLQHPENRADFYDRAAAWFRRRI